MALDGNGFPVTTVAGWTVILVGSMIEGRKKGKPAVSISADFLKQQPVDLSALLSFQAICQTLFGWTTEDFHPVPDWIRMAFAWQEEQEEECKFRRI